MLGDYSNILWSEDKNILAQFCVGSLKRIDNTEKEISDLRTVIAMKFFKVHNDQPVRFDIIRWIPFLIGILRDTHGNLAWFFLRRNHIWVSRSKFVIQISFSISFFRGYIIIILVEPEE